jgi:hypothetical protein
MKHRSIRVMQLAMLATFLSLPTVAAADDTIVTDRPDVAESSETVGAWRVQVETAGDVETTHRDGRRLTGWRTPTKLRLGLGASFELHFETDGFAHDRQGGTDLAETGMADLDVGFKIHLLAGDGAWPSLGLLAALTLPIGSGPFSSDTYALSPTLALDWELSAAWGLGVNVGVTAALDNRDEQPDTLRWAVAIGRSWAPLLRSLRTYVEIFGEQGVGGDLNAIAVDGGFAWLVTPLLQLDLTMRVGLTNDAPDVGGALGLSFKV